MRKSRAVCDRTRVDTFDACGDTRFTVGQALGFLMCHRTLYGVSASPLDVGGFDLSFHTLQTGLKAEESRLLVLLVIDTANCKTFWQYCVAKIEGLGSHTAGRRILTQWTIG